MFDLDRAKKAATVFEEWTFANPAGTIDISDVALSVWGYRAALDEIDRLRSLNESLMENGNDLRTRCQKAEARIKELEADRIEARAQYLLFMNDNPGCIAWNFDELDETEQDALREQARYMLELEEPWAYVQLREARELIKRLEAAFLESEAENQFHRDYGESDWEIHPDEEFDDHHGRNWYREEAREALERIKELEAEVDGMDENLVRGGDEGCPKHV